MSLRIVFCGDLRPFTRSWQRARALAQLGHRVDPVSTTAVEGPLPGLESPTLAARVRHRLRRPLDEQGANGALLAALERGRADLLWVEQGRLVRPATLERARSDAPGTPHVLFSEDALAFPHNRSRYLEDALPLYDLVVTTKRVDEQRLPALGARRVLFRFKGFDPGLHRPVDVDAETRARLGAAVGFVGTFEAPRAEALLRLAEAGFDVRVFGNGWDAWRGRHQRLVVEGRPVWGEDYVRCIAATDVNLGFLRAANADLHTDRSVEIPACGGYLLAPRSDDHEALFEGGREADWFEDERELQDAVRHALEGGERRRSLAAAARARCLRDGYDHATHLGAVLEALGLAVARAEVPA